jgi:RNA polymerase sigma factor (sigma-70 family)
MGGWGTGDEFCRDGDDAGHLADLDSDALIRRYVRGDDLALGEIWRRYQGRMRAMATYYLRRYRDLGRHYDADDAVCEAMHRLAQRAHGAEHVDRITCSNDFWLFFRNLLRQCIRDECDRQAAIKRGGGGSKRRSRDGARRSPSGRPSTDGDVADNLQAVASREPSPESVVLGEELTWRLMGLLDDEQRLIAGLRLSGRSVPEIVRETGRSERTVFRRLTEIRQIWGRSGLLD